jgi:arylformamidase
MLSPERGRVSKRFFFEKKNQKTFATWGCFGRESWSRISGFLLLFFRKEALCLSDRRGALRAAIALGALVASRASASAAQPGAKIWLDLDQQALNDAFDQSVWAPNQARVIGRFITNSDAWHARAGLPQSFAYGPRAAERLHIYKAARANAPIFFFIHGGAWRSAMAAQYDFAAEMFTTFGAHFVGVDFDWVQDAQGDLSVLAAQLRRALAWLHLHAPEFGGDPRRIHIGGLPAELIKGATLLSGLYDLRPVRLSSRGAYINFTDAMVAELSPIRHAGTAGAPAIVAFGQYDSPEFQRQSKAFAEALRQANKPVQMVQGAGYNHFELMETAANPFGVVGRMILAQMQIDPPSSLPAKPAHPPKG